MRSHINLYTYTYTYWTANNSGFMVEVVDKCRNKFQPTSRYRINLFTAFHCRATSWKAWNSQVVYKTGLPTNNALQWEKKLKKNSDKKKDPKVTVWTRYYLWLRAPNTVCMGCRNLVLYEGKPVFESINLNNPSVSWKINIKRVHSEGEKILDPQKESKLSHWQLMTVLSVG